MHGGEKPRFARQRTTAWTKAAEGRFFATLAETCNIVVAAEAAGVRPQRAYDRRKSDAEFRRRWGEALSVGYARLELMLLERALNGTEKVTRDKYGNESRMRDYSNQVALALLKMHREAAAEADSVPSEEEAAETRERITAKLKKLIERDGEGGGE